MSSKVAADNSARLHILALLLLFLQAGSAVAGDSGDGLNWSNVGTLTPEIKCI